MQIVTIGIYTYFEGCLDFKNTKSIFTVVFVESKSNNLSISIIITSNYRLKLKQFKSKQRV